jgi:hypothetical protein
MTSRTPLTTQEASPHSLESRSQESAEIVTGRQLLPAHRLPVVAKTPMLVAAGVYLSRGQFHSLAVGVTMILSAGLWASLYALNESTDIILEQRNHVSKSAQMLVFALPALFCFLAGWVSPYLFVLFALMTIGQLAYCVPPVRLKRWWWAILLLSGTINPILRLLCGAIWGGQAIAPVVYIGFVGLHLGAAIRARVLLRERDTQLGYAAAPPHLEWAGMFCTGLGFLGMYWICMQGLVPRLFTLYTTLAALFAIYAWSGRETSVAKLRQGWLWFAILSIIALLAMLTGHL